MQSTTHYFNFCYILLLMSSSFSSSNQVGCYCGLPARIRTSYTHENPKRRFQVCLKSNSGPRCSLWEWIDPKPIKLKLNIQKELEDVKAELQNYKSKVDLRKEMDMISRKLYNVIILLVGFSTSIRIAIEFLKRIPRLGGLLEG
ncbi:hypothetical protein L1987_20210 [Smallanthus sonchifolius]|uniref:Uncharacterized protein n=1 Tax=Smallanthus sonchifolius TaxID=185202 RepID=A0ACB9IRM2_9ASTR|nr:hypothetical protein L1987_20210 [Smallanthus sonchifolius]